MTLIRVEDLSVQYGKITVLRDVSLSIEAGEILTVVGPNGSGKTSLLRAIIGSVTPAKGTIIFKPGIKVGYVPQRLNIERTLPMTVKRFLSLTHRLDERTCIDALERAGVSRVLESQMSGLSGGQFQRVLLAKALLGEPEVLILDEATQGLDQPGSAKFYQQIERVRSETGCAVLMISHDLHVVMSASDHVICLNGHICCSGPPASVVSAPEYQELFGTGTYGTFALYGHRHDHTHDEHTPEVGENHKC